MQVSGDGSGVAKTGFRCHLRDIHQHAICQTPGSGCRRRSGRHLPGWNIWLIAGDNQVLSQKRDRQNRDHAP